mmetsp:Transcript_10475/g.27315  ORF Transcript_10475/g.27315 Transcript_10475/m.27315 type:complete len:208 (-) Transcript_10475:583-1206(-)
MRTLAQRRSVGTCEPTSSYIKDDFPIGYGTSARTCTTSAAYNSPEGPLLICSRTTLAAAPVSAAATFSADLRKRVQNGLQSPLVHGGAVFGPVGQECMSVQGFFPANVLPTMLLEVLWIADVLVCGTAAMPVWRRKPKVACGQLVPADQPLHGRRRPEGLGMRTAASLAHVVLGLEVRHTHADVVCRKPSTILRPLHRMHLRLHVHQ